MGIIENLAKDYPHGMIEWMEKSEHRVTKFKNAFDMLDRGLLSSNYEKKLKLAKNYEWLMREFYDEYRTLGANE